MSNEPEVLPEELVEDELAEEEPVDFETERETESESDGDEVPEGADPIAFWRERFRHTQRKLGEQGNELGQLRAFRDETLLALEGDTPAEPPVPLEGEAPAEPFGNTDAIADQTAVGELALELYDALLEDGWPADAGDDHRTWNEALRRAAREHDRLQRYAGRVAEEQLGPLKGLVLEQAGRQLLAREVQEAMPDVTGVTGDEVTQALGAGVAMETWLALPAEARAGLITLAAKSMAYDRLAATPPRVPSPDNPRVALPTGGGRSQDPRIAREIARLRAINPDINAEQAETLVKKHYGVKE
ncbi:MAG: hypothetical protein ACYC7E_18925 [Armatimonadota bacterium]